MSLSIELQSSQQQKLAPQQLQSLSLLQMDSHSLETHIQQQVQENPFLEQDALPPQPPECIRHFFGSSHTAFSIDSYGALDSRLESLPAFLKDQLARQRLPKRMYSLCCYLADLLDENGYLEQADLDSLLRLHVSADMVEAACKQLQSLEPAGVGARSLSECLRLQLERKQRCTPLLEQLLDHHLEAISKKQYKAIASALHCSLSRIQAAAAEIAALEPQPGRPFWAGPEEAPLRPDMFIAETEDGLQLILNDFYLPKLDLSPYYSRLLAETDDAEARIYLQKKRENARQFLQALQQRWKTLQGCGNVILQAQYAFFSGKTRELVPLYKNQIAQALGLHPSTITRALQGKFLQCRSGVYPLNYFFSPAITPGGPSQQAVKLRLRRLLDEYGPQPVSDAELCRRLAQQGVHVARRTVSKYRLQMASSPSYPE